MIRITSLILVPVISWLGPQFLYQIRPYTFYISGFAVACIAAVAISGNIVALGKSKKYRWNYLFILTGYFIGFQISSEFLYYLILGLSVLLVLFDLAAEKINFWMNTSIIASLIIAISIYLQFSLPLIFHKEQVEYEDKVVFSAESQFHQLVITQWHENFWFYLDKLKNLSSIDEYLYYEPMVHTVFRVESEIRNALVMGGENGCLIRELLKHNKVERIDIISYDSLLRNLGMESIYFTKMNKNAFQHKKVHVIHENLLDYMINSPKKYDAIFIDLPDPRSIETNQYYTREFYNIVRDHLDEDGIMITQAGSPYFATQAFYAIGQTINKAGFNVLPIHNQILTLGEWGWYLCAITQDAERMKKKLTTPKEMTITTRWFNDEAASLVTSFGKTYFDTLNVGINSMEKPFVYQYYLKGNWNLN